MSMLSRTYKGAEPNIRHEVNSLIYGTSTEPARGHYILILRPILTKPCCFNKKAGKWDEASTDCKNCEGIGYDIEHVYSKSYKSYMSGNEQAGAPVIFHPHQLSYFVPHNTFSTMRQAELSKLIEIDLDENGNIIEPIVRSTTYNVQTPIPYREDGKIQYWKLNVSKLEV